MALTYKSRHGVDWPAEMPDPLIDLTVAKKWREFEAEYGIKFKDPWIPMLDAANALLGDEYLKVSEWTEQHFHDWVMHDKLIVWGCASSSKALLLDEPVYFPDHIGTVGEVKVGDSILDAVGGTATVIGIREQRMADLYRVSFSDGSSTVCSRDHLWEVSWTCSGRKTAVLSAFELSKWTESMISSYSPSIPTVLPVGFLHRDVPVDPYVLGCLLGDGTLTQRTPRLASSGADSELRDEVDRRLSLTMPGYRLSWRGGVDYSISRQRLGGPRERNRITTACETLGLHGVTSSTKFVPDIYKINSVDVRMDILAGLLDTDGCVDSSGVIRFNTVSRRLAEDVKFLCESIGAVVTVTSAESSYTRGGARRKCGITYSVWIKRLPARTAKRLFYLSRKRDRVVEPSRSVGRKHITKVELIPNREDYPAVTRCLVLSKRDSGGVETRGLFPVGGFTVTHNSNDMGLLMILDWMVDPYDTVTLLGSTSKVDLKSRSWESVVRYHNALKVCNKDKFLIPGKISKQGQALVNVDDDDIAASAGEKAGIQGRALNEDGRLQGAHAKYVRLVVDELAEITNHEAIKVAISNLRVGTRSFKFIGLANPESWANPSCQYCMPPGGASSVNVDTGSWTSTFGCFVRHHDGFKSPCVRRPELRSRFPFLIGQDEIDATIKEADGNADAPQVWKMVRGFPVPSGTAAPVVLDPAIAERNHVMDEVPADPGTIIGTAAGIDPAWSEGGDGACRARVYVVRDAFGRSILNFTGGLTKLAIYATDPRPPVQQMRDQVINLMRQPCEASFHYTAIDASANQGLADDLMIYAGADCLPVNNSVRASESPLRAYDPRPVRETIHDRGTEAWCVLAEFCKAGQVRGLPAEAVRALTTRRFAVKKDSLTPTFPLRLESKKDFRLRFKKSPDEADACALAALAVKERLGLPPYGYVVPPQPQALVNTGPVRPAISVPDMTDGVDSFDGDGYDVAYDD